MEGAKGALLRAPPLPTERQKGEARAHEDGLPPDAAIIGSAAPGERCLSCGKAGGVSLIRRRPGAEADHLHVACAARAWGGKPLVDLKHLLEEDTGAEDIPDDEIPS